MRLFERLRTGLGLLPIQLQDDSKTTGDGPETTATAPSSPRANESMCCGHCSGNAEGHSSELPGAR